MFSISTLQLTTLSICLGSNYYVRILSTIDRELLKPNASVALHKHSNALVDILPPEADSSISMLQADEKPEVSYADIGGKWKFSRELFYALRDVFNMFVRRGKDEGGDWSCKQGERVY